MKKPMKMSGNRYSGLAIAVTMACTLAGARGVSAQAARAAGRLPNTLTADVTVRHSSVGADGTIGPAAQTVTYHWEETETAAGLKTAMTLVASESPTVRTKYGDVALGEAAPFVRIEDPGDGSELRLLDRHGKPIELTEAQRRRFTKLAAGGALPNRSRLTTPTRNGAAGRPGRERSARGLTIDGADNLQRRARLKARFGAAKGKVRNLDRYLLTDGEHTVETLADPASGVVLEMNEVEKGALRSHRTWEYAPLPSGQLVQRRVHSERALAGHAGLRAVTDITFDNVKLERRDR